MNWPYWKNRISKKLGLPEDSLVISLSEAAEREKWDLRQVLPGNQPVQGSLPHHGTMPS